MRLGLHAKHVQLVSLVSMESVSDVLEVQSHLAKGGLVIAVIQEQLARTASARRVVQEQVLMRQPHPAFVAQGLPFLQVAHVLSRVQTVRGLMPMRPPASLVPEIQLALMVSVRCVKMASYQTAPLSAVRNAGLVKLEQMAEAGV